MAIKIICDDAHNQRHKADLIFTDPPYDMPGAELHQIINNYEANHLLLITTMKQFVDFIRISDWEVAFDLVLDAVMPKKSKSVQMPHFVHQSVIYLKKPKTKSIFNRKLSTRSDTTDGLGYWPTILRAPRERLDELFFAKNEQAMTDILAAFDCESIIDMFAGTGTNGLAAFACDKSAILIERDPELAQLIRDKFSFLGIHGIT